MNVTTTSTMKARRFQRPSEPLYRSEPWRAVADVAAYWKAFPSLTCGPPGDRHAVLVFPGLMADDTSTAGLRAVLRARGYQARPWRLGPNIGPSPRVVAGVFAALDAAYDATGGPVSLVGWSLGGFFARELTRLRPAQVRQVITLGTPLQMRLGDDPALSRAGWLFEALRPLHGSFFEHVPHENDLPPLHAPSTSVYSRLDGIVPWEACLTSPGPRSENIEVSCSHSGMGCHPTVLSILLDRLAQPADTWRPYVEGQ